MSQRVSLLLLLLVVVVVTLALQLVQALPPTFPRPITGRPSCLQPAKYLQCVRETRSKFVVGMGTSYGEGFGVKWVCSDGGINTFLQPGTLQEPFDMSVPDDPFFPKLPNGQPDLRALHPYGSPITQMIVLKAANPWGSQFGVIPAIIFAYLETDTITNTTNLDFAICGNIDYAMYYLDPSKYPPPPTQVTLQTVYTNPLSAEAPARYLGTFEGKCGLLGRNYLFGDPYTSTKLPLLMTFKACFAPITPFVARPAAPPPAYPERILSGFKKPDPDYQPCYYDKANAKGSGTSLSCAAEGLAIATGKWAAINIDTLTSKPVGWAPKGKAGRLSRAAQPEVFKGTDEGVAETAPAFTPAPAPPGS